MRHRTSHLGTIRLDLLQANADSLGSEQSWAFDHPANRPLKWGGSHCTKMPQSQPKSWPFYPSLTLYLQAANRLYLCWERDKSINNTPRIKLQSNKIHLAWHKYCKLIWFFLSQRAFFIWNITMINSTRCHFFAKNIFYSFLLGIIYRSILLR